MTTTQNKNSTQKTLVIFDLDGTLIDSAPDLAAAINRMYAKLSLPDMPIETIKSWVGNGSLKLVERALAAHGIEANKIDEAHEIFWESMLLVAPMRQWLMMAYPWALSGYRLQDFILRSAPISLRAICLRSWRTLVGRQRSMWCLVATLWR